MSSAAAVPNGNGGVPQRTILGHPVGLYVLFFTEMWERFSYYGMRALLMLYMVNYFKWSQGGASGIYKWYTSLVYLTPLLGGYLADRYLGNRRAVIIGAVLMAIGHFLMAFEAHFIFYSALVFLIIGNGFFKPNMSTQVGRLYPTNDSRRDGAYTIFYMGINLGAFLSPLVCGWLAQNTPWKYHAGFAAAGVGMVIGLVTYLVGLRWVKEIDPNAVPQPVEPRPEEQAGHVGPASTPAAPPLTEAQAENTPSAVPLINSIFPGFLLILSTLAVVVALPLYWVGFIAWDSVIGLWIASGCGFISAWISYQVKMAIRDRVIAIFVLGLFVVFFWAAFEQAGNALNLWADKTTDRFLTTEAPPPPVFPPPPDQPAEPINTQGILGGLFDPVPTAWFQSINALGIFLIAPVFAFLWTWLDRNKILVSIPMKMALGVLLMGAAFAVMTWAAKYEDGPSEVSYAGPVPPLLVLNEQNQVCIEEDGHKVPVHAGRLVFDAESKRLNMTGVLPDIERDRIVRETAPAGYREALKDLQKQTEDEGNGSVVLAEVPPGFDLRYAGLDPKKVTFDAETKTLKVEGQKLAEKDVLGLLVAGGDKDLRTAVDTLFVTSAKYRVSSWWLFWFYILATLGELCLSPVGLSMVSKLAPAKFATMLMGLWLLTSFFGNFAAGAFGEIWGTVAPIPYFLIFVAALGGASLVLFALVWKVVQMMHGVR